MYDLATITRYLEGVREACKADAKTLARDARLAEELGAISGNATRMLSDFVLRFGVIGDSNAGKSRLIGGLIGKVDALDSSGMPWTGNISILRVRSDPTLQATTLGSHQLRFITKAAACECMKYLLDTFVAELDGLVGGAEFAAKGRELRAALTEAALVPPTMLTWLEATWNAMATQSINLYMRLTELARFALTWQFFGSAVAGKSEVAASAEAAKAASRLPKEIRAESFADFTRLLTQKIASVTGGGPLTALPTVLSPELAQACYPLVHDVRIEARVPTAIWPLADLRVEAIELFDFPGLAAQGTAARDAFLSSRERRENRIHTWVIVVNSGELKGSQATEIVKQLPPDRIVAVANRFDALPIWTDGHIEELERMVEPQAPPRSQEDVLERLELLTPLTTSIFEKLTCPERCVFVSAMLGLAELDEMHAVHHRVLTDSERRNWPAEITRSKAVQPKWGELAEKIRAVDAAAPLAGWLSTYADPAGQAGLVRLRRILFEHANAVGLVQLTQEMNLRIGDIEDSIQAFLVRANRHVEESQAKANELRGRLDELLKIYSDAGEPPTSIEEIRVRPNGPIMNGGLSRDIALMAPADKKETPLLQIVHDEALMRIWDWREWKALLEAGRADGFIDCSARAANAQDDDDKAPWELEVASRPPVRAGELHEAFRQAYGDVESIAVAALRSALSDFLAGLGTRLASLAGDLSMLAQTSPKNVINFALMPQQSNTASRFFKQMAGQAPAEPPTSVFWRDRFPYLIQPDEHGQLTPGPFFGWARERRRAVRNKTEHQIYVFRLRTELANAVEAGVARQAAAGLLSFRNRFNEMRATLDRVVDQLKNQSNSNLLALFGKAVQAAESRHPTLALASVRVSINPHPAAATP